MKQAGSIKGLQIPMILPGLLINTSPPDHATIEQMRMMRFTRGGRGRSVAPRLLQGRAMRAKAESRNR